MSPASLVVQTSFLGDMVLTTPLIAELALGGPVDVVAIPGSAGLLANSPDVREVVVYDKRGADRGAAAFLRLARRLARGGYSAAYLAQGSVRSAALVLAAGVTRRVGFQSSAGRPLYTERIAYRDDLHHTERLWRLAAGDAAAQPSVERLRPRLHPGATERAAVSALLADSEGDTRPLVVLAPGSVWATKRWPYYPALAVRLAQRARIAIIGASHDAPLAAAIVAAVDATVEHGTVVDATGRLSLLGSAELLRRAAALVTNDSAPQHLASAVGTPTVTVFGPTAAEFGFGPMAPGSVAVGHRALSCRPCDRHGPAQCPLRHWRCMRELDAAAVADDVWRAMATPTSGS